MTVVLAVLLALTPATASSPGPDPLVEAGRALDQVAVFVHEAERVEIERAVGVMLEDVARFVDAVTPRPAPVPAVSRSVPSAPALAPAGGGGSCYGSSVPDWIVTRESGGDPTVTYGGGHADSPYASGGLAWGCYQFMPATWSANCADLATDVAGQRACADRVSNGGTNLAPWR